MQAINLSESIYEQGNPLEYPSEIPENPVLVSGEFFEELRLSDDFRSFFNLQGDNIDQILRRNGSAPVSERIAQVAFGAHRNITNIAWKLANYSSKTGDKISRDIVIVPAHIRDADVVACNISSGGHVYSGLLPTREGLGIRKYLLGNKCPMALLLLDEKQMEAMHHMGGVTKEGDARSGVRCEVADVEAHLGGGMSCMAQIYNVTVPFLSFGDRPIAFGSVSTTGRSGYPGMNQQEMFVQINKVLKAEDAVEDRVPIADTLNAERRRLKENGADVAKEISGNRLFSRIKSALAERHALRDEDNKIRMGLEDVYEIREPKDNWKFSPIFEPEGRST